MIAGVFKVFFSTDAQNQKAKRRRKLLEQEHSAQRECDYAQLVVDRQAELQFERERLKGTGKVPFVDWEESFFATHIIRFRRPSPLAQDLLAGIPTGTKISFSDRRAAVFGAVAHSME